MCQWSSWEVDYLRKITDPLYKATERCGKPISTFFFAQKLELATAYHYRVKNYLTDWGNFELIAAS